MFREYRGITSELYGGGPDLRIRQELLLGIAGWRLLRALGIQPDVCHLNEGHAAFALLERAASYMEDTGQPFSVALTVTRAGNLFTTHTAVEAGFDRFPPDLMRSYLSHYCSDRLRIPFEELMALGRRDGGDNQEPFNMAYLAVRGCGAVNGVSRLHGEVSRHLFQPLFPRWPTEESLSATSLMESMCPPGNPRRPNGCGQTPGERQKSARPATRHLADANRGEDLSDRLRENPLRAPGGDPGRMAPRPSRPPEKSSIPRLSPLASRGALRHTSAPIFCFTIPPG